jgi:DNA polymerase III alpha subunit
MGIIPLFKSHYSIGRSILTLEEPDDRANTPKSIVDLALKNKLKKVFLVEDNMSGFLEAYRNCQKNNLQLIFGLRITVCPSMGTKDPESLKKSCKYIIFVKNISGYKKLIKIYTDSAKNGFYYEPRADFALLKEIWDDKDLSLVVPFYDSFIYENVTSYSVCVPDFSFTKPLFFIEDNNLPLDSVVKNRVDEYVDGKYDYANVKSVYYAKKDDFKTYLTFRCINNRTKLDKPNIEHMSSNEFSLESWKEKNG